MTAIQTAKTDKRGWIGVLTVLFVLVSSTALVDTSSADTVTHNVTVTFAEDDVYTYEVSNGDTLDTSDISHRYYKIYTDADLTTEYNMLTAVTSDLTLYGQTLTYSVTTGGLWIKGANAGSCGDNLTWSINNNSTLVISGSGDMTVYDDPDDVPWIAYAYQITTVEIDDTVTSISPYAFFKSTQLTEVTLPNAISTIPEHAFEGCTKLTTVTRAGDETFTILGNYAFFGCTALSSVDMGGTTTYEEWTFPNSWYGFTTSIDNENLKITVSATSKDTIISGNLTYTWRTINSESVVIHFRLTGDTQELTFAESDTYTIRLTTYDSMTNTSRTFNKDVTVAVTEEETEEEDSDLSLSGVIDKVKETVEQTVSTSNIGIVGAVLGVLATLVGVFTRRPLWTIAGLVLLMVGVYLYAF